MRAGLWFTAGAAAGVYGMVRLRRLAEAFTPDGMRDRVNAAFVGARMFAEEVAQGQADAEDALREHYRQVEAEHRDRRSGRELTAAPGPAPDGSPQELNSRTTTTATPAASTQEG